MTDPLDGVVIGTWAAAPDRFWAASWSQRSLHGYGSRWSVRHHHEGRVPGVRIEFETRCSPSPCNDTAHQRLFLLAGDKSEGVRSTRELHRADHRGVGHVGHQTQQCPVDADGTKLVHQRATGRTSLYDAVTGAQLDVPSAATDGHVVSPNGVAVGARSTAVCGSSIPDTLGSSDDLPGCTDMQEIVATQRGRYDRSPCAERERRDPDLRRPSRTELGDDIPDVDGAIGYFAHAA